VVYLYAPGRGAEHAIRPLAGFSGVLQVDAYAAYNALADLVLDRARRFDLYPARLAGDSAYGSAEMLRWLVYEHGIEPHVMVFDKSARRDGTFSREDFAYDRERDAYVCPAGRR
jgi:Transposase IS66 family